MIEIKNVFTGAVDRMADDAEIEIDGMLQVRRTGRGRIEVRALGKTVDSYRVILQPVVSNLVAVYAGPLGGAPEPEQVSREDDGRLAFPHLMLLDFLGDKIASSMGPTYAFFNEGDHHRVYVSVNCAGAKDDGVGKACYHKKRADAELHFLEMLSKYLHGKKRVVWRQQPTIRQHDVTDEYTIVARLYAD